MPVWHEATRKLREEGLIQLVGLIQEQHPDRCKLFMQWKQMDWPVLIDPLNLLEVSVVPLALLIDEHGVVREVLRDPHTAVEKLSAEFDSPSPPATQSKATQSEPASVLGRVSDALLFAQKPRFEDAIHLLDASIRENSQDGALHFARGVAYRMRYDSPLRREGDFAEAVSGWQRALDRNPNQYIWRRRIQQYGPRLDKPYAFYDWVEQARRDIIADGRTPIALGVEPTGAELAGPAKELAQAATQPAEPDPQGRITRDTTPLASVEITVVPPLVHPGQSVRVHVVFRPNPRADGHWNNEGDPFVVWINPPAGWTISERRLTCPSPANPISEEVRKVEFEVQAPTDASPGVVRASGYALYGVCKADDGMCLYRRSDLAMSIEVAASR